MVGFLPTSAVPTWLDDITGDQALEWASRWSSDTVSALADAAVNLSPRFRSDLEQRLLEALNTDARIPYPVRHGAFLYNFWRDGEHPRGLWRRTSLESFLAGLTDGSATEWEVLIDVDKLAADEGENWVWKGTSCRYPEYDRALIRLSRGGADATVIREFNLETCEFVPESEAFYLPEAKSDVSWVTRDSILVGTDFGPDSLTSSGYPRQVRKWNRGSSLDDAELVFAGHVDDVAVGGWFDNTEGFQRLFVERAEDFYNMQTFVSAERPGKLSSQFGGHFSLQIIEVPSDCSVSVHREWLVLMPRTDFAGIPAGAVAVVKFEQWLKGNREVEILFAPDEHSSFQSLAWTKDYVVLTTLHDVATRLVALEIGSWRKVDAFGALPEQATVSVIGTSPERDNELWLVSSSMTAPATLWHGYIDHFDDADVARGQFTVARRAPELFEAGGLETRLHWATSADGTKIPYRITGAMEPHSVDEANRAAHTSEAGLSANAEGGVVKRPTLVHAYGGFEVSLVPDYSAVRGLGWLERGGYFVEANLRGGGEFGPKWHSSVVKTERMRVYEDHQAVLKDLVARGYCTSEQLAVRGGSNGGLLSGVCLTLYPELVGAVVSQVPLADMLRYHTLSAGASWMAEYGDPDNPTERAAIEEYSPVQRVARREDVAYPPVLVTTSTRDDRVHPAHARSLAWLLREAGQDVDYYENIEGGHAGAADNKQVAFMESLIYTWLWTRIGGE